LILILAKNYHFSEEFILTELPFARALRYYHAAIWAEGAWTIKPAPKAKVESAIKVLESLKEKYHAQSSDDIEF